ncbi:MAG TPA: rhomboid family intramembrane serine protease [Kofleriaceae bacterium]|jgi:membrane associated rhomboid family serine protease
MAVIVQRQVPPVTARLIALVLGLSLVAVIDAQMGGQLYLQLALLPAAVWHGQLWRLATWPFVMGGPLPLIYTCVVLYTCGSDLLTVWGKKRYLRYLAAVVAAAGVGTALLGLVLPGVWGLPYLGGMVLADAIIIAWARQFPEQPVQLYFFLLVRGETLVNAVVGVTVVFALYFGIDWMMPELLGVAAALLYTSRSSRRWWLKRRYERLRRHLRVVRGEPTHEA